MNRIALESNWLGTTINYNLKAGDWLNTNCGVSVFTYYRDHEGSYNGVVAYANTGRKNEVSPYAKAEANAGIFSIYGDVQYRYSVFSYNGQPTFETQKYNFLNWSGGASVKLGTYANVYYGIGRSHREPTRTDYFVGEDDFLGYNTIPDYYGIDDDYVYTTLIPETVLDQELGFRYNNGSLKINTNLYYMNFENEIVLNGDYGPNGILLHQNVDKSFRSGIELEGSYKWSGFKYTLVGNFSYNQIKEDGETFEPVLSPTIIINNDLKYKFDRLYVGTTIRYVGDSFIDFSNDHVLPSYTSFDAYVGFQGKNLSLQVNLNNLTNEINFGNAVMGYDGNPLYFVSAGENGLVTMKLNF
jgi:iron complex outermembrane receptor protein